MKDYNILNFIKNHTILVGAFVLATLSYILFEFFIWFTTYKTNKRAIDFNKLVEWFNHEDALIIDLRTAEHYNSGHIVGSTNILFTQLNSQHNIFTNNSDRKIILVDQDGRQAEKCLAELLKAKPINNLWFLTGGLAAWRTNNMPLVSEKFPLTTTHATANNIMSLNLNNKLTTSLEESEQKTKSANIIIYTKDACPYCLSAKNLLRSKNYFYQEIKIPGADSAEFAEMIQLTGGASSVPQIFINNKHIGGFDALKALNDTGELLQILQQNK